MATYWLKIANFPPHYFHLAPSIVVTPLQFLETLKNPDSKVLRGADGENFTTLANSIVLTQYSSVVTSTHTDLCYI